MRYHVKRQRERYREGGREKGQDAINVGKEAIWKVECPALVLQQSYKSDKLPIKVCLNS